MSALKQLILEKVRELESQQRVLGLQFVAYSTLMLARVVHLLAQSA